VETANYEDPQYALFSILPSLPPSVQDVTLNSPSVALIDVKEGSEEDWIV
jgi:hypothetical protein